MDFLILIIAAVSLLLFFIAHLIILRFAGSGNILKGTVNSFLSASILFPVLLFTGIGFFEVAVSFFVYSLGFVVYVWGPLGFVTTSLRLNLLTEILKNGDKGIPYEGILKKYNRREIAGNRLKRLIEGGEIVKSGRYFVYNKKISYFRFHLLLLKILNRLYIKNRYNL